jgi:Ca2+-binding RTX toxin-like protein
MVSQPAFERFTYQLNTGLCSKMTTIELTSGNDNFVFLGDDVTTTLLALEGDDVISLGANLVEVFGGAGDDTVTSYTNPVTGEVFHGDNILLELEEGNDTVSLFGSAVSVGGGAGNDLVTLTGEVNAVFGGDDNDAITVFGDGSTVQGDAGDDTLNAYGVFNVIDGGDGNDYIVVADLGRGTSGIDGGTGDDVINAAVSFAEINGGDGFDVISVQGNSNIIEVGPGAATVILAGQGNALYGSEDEHTVVFAAAADGGPNSGTFMKLGAGADLVSGQMDSSELRMGLGYNQLNLEGSTNIIVSEGFAVMTVAGNENFIVTESPGDIVTVSGNRNAVYTQGSDDVITITGEANNAWGGEGNDTITVSGSESIAYGEEGNDRLIAVNGDESVFLFGGSGDDTYVVKQERAFILEEDESFDTVEIYSPNWSAYDISGIEVYKIMVDEGMEFLASDDSSTIYGGKGSDIIGALAGDDVVLGGAGSDMIGGGDGNDVLNGGTDFDLLGGELGDDRYLVLDDMDEIVEIENEGFDTVETTLAEFRLSDNVEAIIGTNSKIKQDLYGNGDDNWLEARAAGSVLIGGAGNDTYVIGTAKIKVQESVNEGVDTVTSDVTDLKLNGFENIENATLTGAMNLNLTGNAMANVLTGNVGRNVLKGGAGADTFVFLSASDSGLSAKAQDWIMDFKRLVDKIDLSAIDASVAAEGNGAFSFIGKQGFHKIAGELRYFLDDGHTVVAGDTNGDGRADFKINLECEIRLSTADFIL